MVKYFKYGGLAGVASAIISILVFGVLVFFGVNPFGWSKPITYLPTFIMLFLALWYFRETILNGELHFHQGFSFTVILLFVSCALFSLFVLGYLSYCDPELLVRYKKEARMILLSLEKDLVKEWGDKWFQEGLKEMENTNAFKVALDEFKTRLKTLFFFVLLASFIMRRTPAWTLSK